MDEHAYERRQVPKTINIHGYDLNYKDSPLKGNIFRYRCRRVGCKYFVKIDKENWEKIIKKEKDILLTEINEYTYKNEIISRINVDSVRTEKDSEQLARKLIILNLNEPLE